jgi:hypothetical protein
MGWNENFNRKRIEELVMKLANGRKMAVVLKEMKIDLTEARRMLNRRMGRKVMKELQDLQALQRGLAQGKAAAAAEEVVEEEVPAELTEEERAVLKASAEARAAELRERYAG